MKALNLALRFLLELGAIAAVAYWGFTATTGVARWALAVGAAAAVIAVWWLFVSPHPTVELARPVRFAIELGVWAAAAGALYATDNGAVAIAFFVVAAISGALNWSWEG